jgi:hypothetical protein
MAVLSLKGASLTDVRVHLVGMDGKVIRSESMGNVHESAQLPLNLSGLASGLYLVRVQSAEGEAALNLSVQR